MKLYFQNSRGVERLVAEPSNREEVVKEINKFLDDHNYKSYYQRMWVEDKKVIIDVGSWSEFFWISHSDGSSMEFEEINKGECANELNSGSC